MLGSTKTKLPPLTLTSWVKDASPFGREKGLGTSRLKKVFLGLKRDGFYKSLPGPNLPHQVPNLPRTQFATKSVRTPICRGPICLEPVFTYNIETQLDKIYVELSLDLVCSQLQNFTKWYERKNFNLFPWERDKGWIFWGLYKVVHLFLISN